MTRSLILTPTKKFRLPVVILGSFFIAFFGFIPGMGIPGIVMLLIGDFILQWTAGFFGFLSMFTLEGDPVWPAGLLMTIMLFPFLVGAYLIAFRLYCKSSRQQQWLVWTTLFLLWSILGTAFLTMVAYFPN